MAVINESANGTLSEGTSTLRLKTAMFILQMVLCVPGILGNTLVCVTILRAKFMHNITNLFIVHMAVADLLVCLVLVAIQERYLPEAVFFHRVNDHLLREIYCMVFHGNLVLWLVSDVSVFSMVCVTVERYVAIIHPFKYRNVYTKTTVGLMLTGVWAVAIIARTPVIVTNSYNPETNNCHVNAIPPDLAVFNLIFEMLVFCIPVLCLFWCYIKILKNLRSNAKNQLRNQNRAPANELLLACRRVTKVLFIVSTLYLIVWFPNFILCSISLFNFVSSQVMSELIVLLQLTLALINSIVNPIVYALKYKEFQRGVREYVFPRWCRHRRIAPINSDIRMQ